MKTLVNNANLSDAYTQTVACTPDLKSLIDLTGSLATTLPDGMSVYEGESIEVAKRMGWPILSDGTQAAYEDALHQWHKIHSPIFRYAILYPFSLRDTVAAFLATASGEWSRQRAKGQTPEDWQITPLSGDHKMIVVDVTLAQASQYGSAEAVARQTAEFASVDVVQWLSPDVDWGGMQLTNPETGKQEQYAPGEARITTLQSIEQHQQVAANDIPSLVDHTVA